MFEEMLSVEDKIKMARIKMLFGHPFFGNMALRFKPIDASSWCKTAATDGRNFYYNYSFFEKMTASEIEFVLAHELYHMIFDHCKRAEGRQKTVWNYAIDYAVNGLLIRDNIGNPPDINYLYKKEYTGIAAEELYDMLMKDANIDYDKLGQLLDEHLDWSKQDGEDSDRPSYSKEELQTIRDEVIDAILQASASCAGKMPGEISRLISQLTEPKMNWREILRNQIQSMIKSDYTWQRPSRKTMAYGIYLPSSNFDETIDIVIAMDNSGSCYREVVDFLSEVQGIMQSYQDYKIKIFTFDTAVHNEQDYTADSAEDLVSYEVKGGGGTEFQCVWDYMKDNGIVPKKLLFFTDGYNSSHKWTDSAEYCDTIFVIHSNDECVAPFGQTLHYSVSSTPT